jgi:hypothetical protein
MNEFTKKELIILSEALSVSNIRFVFDDGNVIYHGMQYKINQMIDNYCEHEKTRDGFRSKFNICLNCNQVVE